MDTGATLSTSKLPPLYPKKKESTCPALHSKFTKTSSPTIFARRKVKAPYGSTQDEQVTSPFMEETSGNFSKPEFTKIKFFSPLRQQLFAEDDEVASKIS